MRVSVAFLFIFLALAVGDVYGRKHPKSARNEHEDDDGIEEGDWPQPDEVHRFDLPDWVTGFQNSEATTSSSGKHHHQKSSNKKMTTHHQ